MINFIQRLLFGHRRAVLILFAIITLLALGTFAVRVRPDAGFDKLLPSNNAYIEGLQGTQEQFGGGNVLLVALEAKHGDIFQPKFFDALKRLTDEVFFLPGVDRTHVASLSTRQTPCLPKWWRAASPAARSFRQPSSRTRSVSRTVKTNAIKAGIVGQLVADNFRSAVVSAKLNDFDPHTGVHLDYSAFANELDAKIARPIRYARHGRAYSRLRAGDRRHHTWRPGDCAVLRHFARGCRGSCSISSRARPI